MSDALTDEERWIVDAERHFVEQGLPDNGKGKLLAIIDRLARELEVASTALGKINDIRNSIVGYQAINWSAHIYPLVAALEEAGIKGDGYEKSREMAKTQLERIAGLEAELEVARADATVLNRAKDLLCAANVGVVHPGYDGESTVVFEGDDGGAYESATLADAVAKLKGE